MFERRDQPAGSHGHGHDRARHHRTGRAAAPVCGVTASLDTAESRHLAGAARNWPKLPGVPQRSATAGAASAALAGSQNHAFSAS